jgi:ADP-ribosylglycohydrolase
MKADVPYNDLIGTVAADISDLATHHNELEEIAKNYKIDTSLFEPVALSLYGPGDFQLTFLCKNKAKSNETEPYLVKIDILMKKELDLEMLFKNIHIVLYNKYEKKLEDVDYKESMTIDIDEIQEE